MEKPNVYQLFEEYVSYCTISTKPNGRYVVKPKQNYNHNKIAEKIGCGRPYCSHFKKFIEADIDPDMRLLIESQMNTRAGAHDKVPFDDFGKTWLGFHKAKNKVNYPSQFVDVSPAVQAAIVDRIVRERFGRDLDIKGILSDETKRQLFAQLSKDDIEGVLREFPPGRTD